MFMPRRIVEKKLLAFLSEDIGEGDISAAAVIPQDLMVKAEVIAKEDGVIAGIEEAIILAECLGLKTEPKVVDGHKVKNKQILLELSGDAQTILTAERTLLNLISRMSGIATKTHTLTEQLKKAKANIRLAATRKSAPGLLYFDKKAVIIGGGDPHRLHLDDMILIKDNHLVITGGVEEAIKRAKTTASFSKKIEVEVTSIEDALKAAEAGVDIIMLDNFSPKQAKEVVQKLRKSDYAQVLIEISGGVTPENLIEYAATDVDVISMGGLTHSVKASDVSLEIVKK
ncbi:MAG: carboxylating nicotinate-nucleotide diphosphorylase [Nitrososphaerota archaeon]|jgi:nicotinate-nucleotide pyrophosphorylase (carboxylating)|nr:carboxylating nicotinate-nucleotide diphosphorylase [Nitrososphaerota archaeon]